MSDRDTPAPVAPTLTPEEWRAVKAVMTAALAQPREARAAFVAEACAGDARLAGEVLSLLEAPDTDPALDAPFAPPALVRDAFARDGLVADALAGGTPATTELPAAFREALGDRYRLDRRIGRGGMATVWLAHDLRHGRTVAIKVLHPRLANLLGRERFLREIALTAGLQHPGILPLFDSGDDGGALWYAMPYVDGETLRARLARAGRLHAREALACATAIADALAHAHARGIVHRDVKPENVLLARDDSGAGGRPLVADFGIARALERDAATLLTRTGFAIGTPRYMAPEQARGDRDVDARADVYALGAVLHEMLAGAPPAVAPVAPPVAPGAHPAAPLAPADLRPALLALRPDLPPQVADTVARALAPDPGARFADMAAFAAALREASRVEALRAEVAAAPVVPRRARGVFALLAATLAIGVVAGWQGARLGDRLGAARAVRESAPAVEAGPPSRESLRLTVRDRAGRVVRTIDARVPWTPRVAPDGRTVAYGASDGGEGTSTLWTADLETGATRRLEAEGADANDPQWSPDGRRLAYSSGPLGSKRVFVMPSAGGAPRALATAGTSAFPTGWTPDGRAVLATVERDGGEDIVALPADGGAPRTVVGTPARERGARISPDGRWIAWQAEADGTTEVYVDGWPALGRPTRVSVGGGEHPVWGDGGRTLLFRAGPRLVAVAIAADAAGGGARLGVASVLFEPRLPTTLFPMYDVTPDGRRVVVAGAP